MSEDLAGLPKGWKVSSLGDVCNLRRESINPTENLHFPYVGLEHIDSGVPNLLRFGKANEVKSSKSKFYPNDVLYGKLRPYLDKAAISECEGFCSTDILVIQNKTNFDSYFLVYLLHTNEFLDHAVRTTKGVNHPRTSWQSVTEFIFSLPPLEEQRAIATTLRTIQTAKEARQKELALERERKAALMDYLFTHGTRNEPRKQTELGEIPESWRVVKIEEVFETQLGKMLSQKSKTGISYKKYLRNANVKWGYIDCSEIFEMDFNEQEMQKFKLKTGDILMCEGGEIGRTAIWRDELAECYFQKTIHRLRPRSRDVVTEFFFFWIERAFRFGNIYGVTGTATTIAHFPQEKLRVAKIPLPEASLQKEIVDVLSNCDTKITTLEREINLHDELFRAMLEELMTGKLSSLPLA